MALTITLPAGCYEQPDDTRAIDAQGAKTRDFPIKGRYGDLETFMEARTSGETVATGWVFSSADLRRTPGDTGVLTLHCLPSDTETTGGDGDEPTTTQKALDETWTLKSVRNDMSILAYCGTDSHNPSRELIEAWMKEPDGNLAKDNKYRRPDGATTELSGADLAILAKLRKGIDSVMRFYPMLTKTRTYSTPPLAVYENLATIDAPTVGGANDADRLRKPGNLDNIIEAHTWLKCQDDCALMADGKFQRIESWMGVPSADGGGWDANLYGTAANGRWTMPLEVAVR